MSDGYKILQKNRIKNFLKIYFVLQKILLDIKNNRNNEYS